MTQLVECLEAKEGVKAQFAGVYILKWKREWGPPEYLFRDVDDPLYEAAFDLLATCKTEVIELANLAAMVDPELAQRLMTAVYAAIEKAEGKEDEV